VALDDRADHVGIYSDLSRTIGKRGETIGALRAVAAAAGGRHGLRVKLELNDEAERR